MSKTVSKFKNDSNFTPSILLVSKSPRRQQLLAQAGYQFEPFSLEISEIIDENLNCFEQCKSLARFKMERFIEKTGLKYKEFSVALTSDTMVEFEGLSLGKPKDLAQAKKWLLSYSEKKQFVHTACSLLRLNGDGEVKTWCETTTVIFKKLSEDAVTKYLGNKSLVLDKAGAYGIQDDSFDLIEKIEGSYTNIVGLPLESLKRELNDWGFS